MLWSGFLPRVAPHAPGCPRFEIEDAVKEAAVEFLRRSGIWIVEQVELATTVAAQRGYDVTTNPADAELCRLNAVWVGEDEAEIALPGENMDDAPGKTADSWRVDLESGSRIRLLPAPSAGGDVVKGTVSYVPTSTALGIDDALFHRWRRGIEAKAVAILIAQPKKEWSNPAALAYHSGIFEEVLTEASNKAGPVARRPLRVRAL